MIYVTSLILTLCLAIYTKWQFSDNPKEIECKWKISGILVRVGFIFSPLLSQFRPDYWQDYFFAAILNILFWEILVNIIALKQPWNYKGRKARWDIKLNNWEWYLYTAILICAIMCKILKF